MWVLHVLLQWVTMLLCITAWMKNNLQAYYAGQYHKMQVQMLAVHKQQEAEKKRLEVELNSSPPVPQDGSPSGSQDSVLFVNVDRLMDDPRVAQKLAEIVEGMVSKIIGAQTFKVTKNRTKTSKTTLITQTQQQQQEEMTRENDMQWKDFVDNVPAMDAIVEQARAGDIAVHVTSRFYFGRGFANCTYNQHIINKLMKVLLEKHLEDEDHYGISDVSVDYVKALFIGCSPEKLWKLLIEHAHKREESAQNWVWLVQLVQCLGVGGMSSEEDAPTVAMVKVQLVDDTAHTIATTSSLARNFPPTKLPHKFYDEEWLECKITLWNPEGELEISLEVFEILELAVSNLGRA
ncbi:hypothetical protein K438DRAFT_1788096 [Mycena galopus ATCC 62051]|nr:hypothetical protein K438DRAFT_1788096 [Mycena galopus ATCC 62051]